MKLAPKTFIVLLATFACAGAFVPLPTQAASQITINSASVDQATHVLTVTGQNFGDTKPVVKLNSIALNVTSNSPSALQANIPADFNPGTYLLSVITGNGTASTGYFDVSIGSTGPQGPAGPAGSLGPIGPKGDKGDKGDAGAPGAQGPQGEVGSAGAMGTMGSPGAQGPRGEVGATGAQGPQGESGAQGLAGSKGDKGDAGAQGIAGDSGPKGDVGAVGPQGPKGDTGVSGAQGAQGEGGPIGPQGEKGDKGDVGSQGPVGPQGTAGPPIDENRGNGNSSAVGVQALANNTTGINNTATGWQSLNKNADGFWNTATGYQALYNNKEGTLNTATGVQALFSNISGTNNSAAGVWSLYFNTTGSENTAIGHQALYRNDSGYENTATGYHALFLNTTGNYNIAMGANALQKNTDGHFNTAIGQSALGNLGIDGVPSNNNIAIGAGAGLSRSAGDNNIYIGNYGAPYGAESNTIRIGGDTGYGQHTQTFLSGIFGAGTDVAGVAVFVDARGKLGTLPSSQRFKQDVAGMDKASEAILSLRPVTFRYTKELTKNGATQFGLLAEEVAKVNPDLVVRDEKGEIYSVRYEAVNAMLLNEFLKEHQRVEKQAVEINQLKSALAKQAEQIRAVNARIDRAVPTQVADRE
jgi:hypothetical protein